MWSSRLLGLLGTENLTRRPKVSARNPAAPAFLPLLNEALGQCLPSIVTPARVRVAFCISIAQRVYRGARIRGDESFVVDVGGSGVDCLDADFGVVRLSDLRWLHEA